jgi:hypothetical protein
VTAILGNGFANRGVETEIFVRASGGSGEDDLKEVLKEGVKIRFFCESNGSRVRDLGYGLKKRVVICVWKTLT